MVVLRLSILFLFVSGMLSPAWSQAQDNVTVDAVPDSVIQRLTTSVSDGNTRVLLTPSADRVEISLFGTRTFYSSAQAFYVLRDFFDTHPPADFIIGDATGAGKSCFVRGQLHHQRSDSPLQVYIRLVRQDTDWELHEIRVE